MTYDKFEVGDKIHWAQRINWKVKTMRGIVKKVEPNYITIAPHENAHESYWKRYFLYSSLKFIKTKDK